MRWSELFGKQTPINQLLEEELYLAKRELLEAETHVEFSKSIVEYNKARIKRIEEKIQPR